jgi:hypothetical protein
MRPATIGLGLCLSLLCPGETLPRQAARDVYEAIDREPTPQETLILELMNRFRANPVAECDLIAPPGKSGGGVDWDMFRREMKALKPSPPLAFNLEILDAARKHSWYMIKNEMTHMEQPGKPGFTGVGPGDRMKAAGYKGFGAAENAFRDSGGPLDSHVGYIVDNGAGPGGMQPERGHRRNMMGAGYNEVGPGSIPHDGRLCVTHNFGHRDVRLACGVSFIDLNGNGFYDIGEGLGGVTVVGSDGTSVTTWKAGAYAMDLKGQGAVTLTALIDTEKVTKTFPAGKENVKFDWIVPVEIPLRKADKYLAAVDAAGAPGTPKHTQAVINLYFHTRALYLDADRKKKVQDLTGTSGPELEAHQKAVLDALKDAESPGLQALLDEHRKPYRGTDVDAWFQDAEMVARLKRGVATFLKQPKPTNQERRQMAAAVEDSRKRLKTYFFKADVDALIARLRVQEK